MSMLATVADATDNVNESARCARCGAGWCHEHGTYHMTDQQEEISLLLRYEATSRGGRRVLRKKIRSSD